MLDADLNAIVQHPLIPMAQFNRTLGPIPVEFGGGNRYRVIWAPSRNVLRFVTGLPETVSAYAPNGGVHPIKQQADIGHKAGECWILEMWVNPYRDCTEDEWNQIPCLTVAGYDGLFTRLQVMGPFPRGRYRGRTRHPAKFFWSRTACSGTRNGITSAPFEEKKKPETPTRPASTRTASSTECSLAAAKHTQDRTDIAGQRQ